MIQSDIPSDGLENAVVADARLSYSSAARIWRFVDERVLGTQLVVLVNSESRVLAEYAVRTARDEIERLERVFNHRRADSEVSELNRSRRARVSTELFAVVQAAEAWRAITRGAFDARLGALLRLTSRESQTSPAAIEHVLTDLRESPVWLDAGERFVELTGRSVLSLDAVAKGFIVDAALNAARRAIPVVEGMAISIGGDLRCWGRGEDRRGWRIGIPDPANPAINAPLVDSVVVHNAAIATSGRGPRDCVGQHVRSTTISPFTGQPVRDVTAASVVASHAMDADAIATACMVLAPPQAIAIVDRLERVAARITDVEGRVHESSAWPMLRLAATSPEEHIASKRAKPNPQWPAEWVLSIDYTAPPRQARRSVDFRSPYMAMWITDENNKPVRTVLMVGRELDWQRDNFVWFGINRARSKELVDLRSLPTSVSGRYPVYWAGMDDDGDPVPVGKYILHLETSQERGKHHYRSVALELGRESFRQELPKLEGSGGVSIFYGHPSERYK